LGHDREGHLMRQNQKLWQSLDIINLIRPLYRDHALALSLAEHELDSTSIERSNIVSSSGMVGVSHETKETNGHLDEELKAPKVRAASVLNIYQQLISNIQLTSPTPESVCRSSSRQYI
jgi:hypothetical protein